MSLRLSLTLIILASLVQSCDRQGEPAAQQHANLTEAKDGFLLGVIDRGYAGQPIPDLTFADPQGRTLHLAGGGGVPRLVNLWATWCVPCRKEMPLLDALADDYDGALEIITVSQDMAGARTVAPYFAENAFVHLKPWLDPNASLGLAVENTGMPLTILYDQNGRELWRVSGDYDWSSAAAREAIAPALE